MRMSIRVNRQEKEQIGEQETHVGFIDKRKRRLSHNMSHNKIASKDLPVTPKKSTSKDLPVSPKKSTSKDFPVTPKKNALKDLAVTPKKIGASPAKKMLLSPGNSVLDISGFLTRILPAVAQSGNPYVDIKVKTSKEDYEVIRMMKYQNPSITEEFLKSLKDGQIPLKLKGLTRTQSGTIFFNSYTGSQIEQGVELNFKATDCICLSIAEIKGKKAGSFSPKGCFKWLNEEIIIEKDGIEKRLREGVLYDNTDFIVITIWESFIDFEFIEGQFYEFSDVSLRNYHGLIKLTATTRTTITLVETDDDPIEIDAHITNLKNTLLNNESTNNEKFCCKDIKSVMHQNYFACASCNNQVTIVPGERSVECSVCSRRFKRSAVIQVEEFIIEIENCQLSLSKELLVSCLGEDVLGKSDKEIVDILLYLENFDIFYKKNIVKNLKKHSQ